MLPSYVVHAIDGRLRLRHRCLRHEVVRTHAQALLTAESAVHSVEVGHASLLVWHDGTLNLEALCQKLETAIPEFCGAGEASAPKALVPKGEGSGRRAGLGLAAFGSPRRLELRLLAGLSLLCLGSGLCDRKTPHVAMGLAATLLALRHVWVRRHSL